jgi:hypothetical protein
VTVAAGQVIVGDAQAGIEVLTACTGIFQDGFESGDTSVWSAVTP